MFQIRLINSSCSHLNNSVEYFYLKVNEWISGQLVYYNINMKKTFRIVLNAFLAVMVIIQWVILSTSIPDSSFMSGGFRTLKYFTVLSNLLEAAACIVWIINGNEKLKYVGAVSVGLTFTVVVVFLGPLFGYLMMFTGPSLWMHGIVPLAAMAECIIFNRERLTVRDNLLAVLPMLVYGIFYLGNIIINGIPGNDWYGFMLWGYPVGAAALVIIVCVTYLIGLVLRKLNEKVGVR